MSDPTLLDKIKLFLRVPVGDEEDSLLTPLIFAAQHYLKNAGIAEPGEDAEDEEVAAYELKVALRVHKLYYGTDEFDKALDSMILQDRDYSGDKEGE